MIVKNILIGKIINMIKERLEIMEQIKKDRSTM